MTENEERGSRFRLARKAKGMSMEQLSQQSGVSQSQISTIERGKADPSVNTVTRIAKALDASLMWLMTGSGLMKEDQQDCPTAYLKLKKEYDELVQEMDGVMNRIELMRDIVPGLENLKLENLRPGRSKIGPDPAKDRESVPSKKRRGHPSSPKETPQLAVEFA